MLPIQQPPQFPIASYNLQNVFSNEDITQIETNLSSINFQPSVIGQHDKQGNMKDISDTVKEWYIR